MIYIGEIPYMKHFVSWNENEILNNTIKCVKIKEISKFCFMNIDFF